MGFCDEAANAHEAQSPEHDAAKAQNANSSDAFNTRPHPTAIQNMLRSTTELGDDTYFAQRPSRIPRSNTQSSLSNQSRLSASSYTRTCRQHRQRLDPHMVQNQPPYMRSPSSITRNNTVRSSQSTYQYHPRSRRPRPRSGPHTQRITPYQRSNDQTLYNHRPLASLESESALANSASSRPRSYDPANVSSQGRARSPAPAPAMSNMYEYRNRTRYISRHRSSRTAPKSSSSLISSVRSLEDYRNEHNAPMVSSRPLPPPAARFIDYQSSRQHSISRVRNPAEEVVQEKRLGSITSLSSDAASLAGSVVPFYYDYSESFHGSEARFSAPPRHAMIPEVDVEQDEDSSQTSARSFNTRNASRTMSASPSGLAEVSVKHNRQPSDHSSYGRSPSSKSTVSVRISSQAIVEDDMHAQGIKLSSDHHEVLSGLDASSEVVEPTAQAHGRDATNSPRNWPEACASTFFTNASRSPRNLTDLAARAHSPDSPQMPKEIGSIDAITSEEQARRSDNGNGCEQDSTSTTLFRLPTFRFRPLSIGVSPTRRPLTSPVSIVYGVAEVLSPRPERPTSSQSRKQFSKILDVDQSQPIVDTYMTSHFGTIAHFAKLERVDETDSAVKPLIDTDPQMTSTVQRFGKGVSNPPRPASAQNRWSNVTSHDESTVESLLDQHIECLGLQSEVLAESNTLTCCAKKHVPELEVPNVPLNVASFQHEPRPKSAESSHRPTSLSSSAQQRLVPRRLFASIADSTASDLPFGSSNPDARFSSCWTGAKTRPSYGWLSLPSQSNTSIEAEKSTQTLLFGDYADVDIGQSDSKFRLRRHSSPSLTPVSKLKDNTLSYLRCQDNTAITPCHPSQTEAVIRDASQCDENLNTHVTSSGNRVDSSTSDDWFTTNESTSQSDHELRGSGVSLVPVSMFDGIAGSSCRLANAPQQSLACVLSNPIQELSDTWSNILAARPISVKKATGSQQKESLDTSYSPNHKNSIVKPVNNSCQPNRGVKEQSSVPCLAQPDLGPSMRISRFDLFTGYRLESPHHKQSSILEPKELLNEYPIEHVRHNSRSRCNFNSLRQIFPSSIRGYAFSSQRSNAQQHARFGQACRVERRPDSCIDEPPFPETVAMSDFAYRKHKLFNRIKEWCRRHCVQRPCAARRTPTPPGGCIV